MANSGVLIEDVISGSPAERAGIQRGDRLISINGEKVRDIIDLMFHSGEPELCLLVARGSSHIEALVRTDGIHSNIGVILKPFTVKKCRNRCIFCFVNQQPPGMRKSLYIKDEDYRMSFLYGNYITLTGLSMEERKRIVEQRLSPIYISVHSTDVDVRNRMLGRADAPDILKDLKYFASHKIRMHTQIVLCPGYNDGDQLVKTINDLYKYYPYVQSIAVVPVGLTSHRKKALRPVGSEEAKATLEIVRRFQSRFMRKHGEFFVFAADEFYIKAAEDFPSLKDYGDLPQIENGVGLVPLFLAQARKLKIKPAQKPLNGRVVTFCGSSFYPYLSGFVERLVKKGYNTAVYEVVNRFFGESVTVTGLLTGRDVMNTLSGEVRKDDVLLIPDVVMKEGDELFLDDVSRKDIEDILGIKSLIIESTPAGMVDAILSIAG